VSVLARSFPPALPAGFSEGGEVVAEQALASMITQMPTRFETAEEDVWVMGALVEINDKGLADSFTQVMEPAPPPQPS